MSVVLRALSRWWQERQATTRPVICEYWVFLPGETMPEQDAVMGQMVGSNPFGSPADPPIGPREGMLFSDVRLSVGFVLRSKNPHAFRPDLLSEHAEPTAAILEGLAASKSFLRLRYTADPNISIRCRRPR